MNKIYLSKISQSAAIIIALSSCTHTGSYRIQSDPPDAAVTINGKAVGKTPLNLPLDQIPHDRDSILVLTKTGRTPTQVVIPGNLSPMLSSTVLVSLQIAEDDVAKINRVSGTLWRAQKLSGMGRYQEALKLSDELLAEQPRFVSAHLLRASILFLSKNVPEAQSEWKKVLEIEPANEDASRALRIIGQMSGVDPNARVPSSDSGSKP